MVLQAIDDLMAVSKDYEAGKIDRDQCSAKRREIAKRMEKFARAHGTKAARMFLDRMKDFKDEDY
jgi:hypothetical protein